MIKICLKKVGRIDENIKGAEDLDLYIRFLENNQMPIYLNFYSHLHRMHTNNLSNGMTEDRYLNTHLKELKDKYKHLYTKLLDK